MKLGFLTTSFPRYSGDLSGNFVFGMARAFARRGHKVKVLAPSPASTVKAKSTEEWLENVKLIHVPYVWPKSIGKLFYGAGVPDNLSSHPWLASQVPGAISSLLLHTAWHSKKLDSIISHWLLPSSLTVGLVRRRGLKHLAIAHSTDVQMLGKLPFTRVLAEKIAGSADHLGFVTSTLRDEFLSMVSNSKREEISGRAVVVPMGVDLQELETDKSRDDVRKELGFDKFTVLFLGRLISIKGVDLLVDAIEALRDVQLIVAGDGPIEDALKNRAREAGVKAEFLGQVGPKKRAELLKACDVVAVPSRRLSNGRGEGMPLVIVEALSAGRPVIATDVSDTEKIVEDIGSGMVVDSGDIKGIGRALTTLREDKALIETFGKNGRNWAKNRDWSELIDKLERLVVP